MHDDSGSSSPAMSQHPRMADSQSSPSLPPTSKDMNDITIDIDDVSSSGLSSSDDSDDDDGGVFFGKHSEAESRFLANISRTTSPRPPSPPSKGSRRQSRLVSRLRKDSTEFHRRKTILAAPPRDDDGEQQEEHSMQERYQREISVMQISPSALASPRKSSPVSPSRSLCSILDHLHVAGSSTQDASSESGSSSTDDFSDCSVDSSDANADSDKENVQCPDSPTARSRTTDDIQLNGTSGCTSNYAGGATNHSVCIGQQGDFEEVLGLDMGGLRLDDFSEGAAGQITETHEEDVMAYDSDDDSEACQLRTVSPRPGSTSESEHLGSHPTEVLLSESPSRTAHTTTSPPSTPIITTVQTSPSSMDPSNEVTEGDSELDPLPVSRAGPSINAFATFSPIRALASPYRSPAQIKTESIDAVMLSPPSQFELPATSGGEALLESPTRLRSEALNTPLVTRTPRQLCPLPTTATPSRAREDLIPRVERGARTLKSQTTTTTASNSSHGDSSLIPVKDRNRALAVRGKLNAAFSTRPGTMGPPQRAVSTSSSLSSSSSNGRPTGVTVTERPASKKVERPTTSVPPRPAPSMSRLPPVSTLGKGPQVSTFRKGAQAKPLSSSLSSRPASAPSMPMSSATTTRPALAPRSLVTHPPKQPISKPTAIKSTRPMTGMPSSMMGTQPQVAAVTGANPLKRPFPVSAMAPPSRQALTTSTGSRPALGLPSRLVWDAGQARSTPVFQIGAAPAQSQMAQIAMKSPARQAGSQRALGTPSKSKTATIGTPSRPNGTPRAIRVKPSFQLMSLAAKAPAQDVLEIAEPTSSGPPSSSTRHISERQASPIKPSEEPQRGSSADHEDVSMQLAQPPSSQSSSSSPPSQTESPTKKTSPRSKTGEGSRQQPADDRGSHSPSGSRLKRTTTQASNRARSTLNTPAAPWMSGKELKTTTDRNTMRNQVYLCAIDRQIVHVPGPRPPSPTSKIRTAADRAEEEKKKSREHRAKRRGISGQEGSPERPVIEKVERARGPGDEEDWTTPARPAKKAKVGIVKSVKWDRELVIIRDDGSGVCPPASETTDEPKRSCVRTKVDLDKHGNLVSTARPKEDLKRSKVVVTALYYDGEEPVPAPAHEPAPVEESTSSSKGSGKRKK